jgi:hypothetical protein
VRNLNLKVDFYLIWIDASIKEGNPDRDLIAQNIKLAAKDHTIMLRSLMIGI